MLNKNSQTKCRTSSIKNIVNIIAFASISMLGLTNTQAADAVKGSQLAQTCMGCHAAPGLRNPGPVYNIPMIGGQHAEYIVSALKAYKNGERKHGTMVAQAASLSDSDMSDIAAFFAGMDGNSRPDLSSDALIAKGKAKAASCAACHGATGDAPTNAFPKLAGQYKSYLIQALKDYRSGDRNNIIMSGQAKTLTIRDIEALSAYFASQNGGLSAPQSKIFKSF